MDTLALQGPAAKALSQPISGPVMSDLRDSAARGPTSFSEYQSRIQFIINGMNNELQAFANRVNNV